MTLLQMAKERIGIFELWQILGLQDDPNKNPCHSPWAKHGSPSFSISKDGRCFNDFSTKEKGDAVTFLAKVLCLSVGEACKKFVELSGVKAIGQFLPRPICFKTTQIESERTKPNFPSFTIGNLGDLRHVAEQRNLSLEGLQIASDAGILRFTSLHGVDVWVVTDCAGWNAQARRMDGQIWPQIKAKAWTLSGSWASWPIGVNETKNFDSVALVEGAPDLLAAFHFLYAEDKEREVMPVAMLGANNRIPSEVLPLFANKSVRIFPHLDPAGLKAAVQWETQLNESGASARCFNFNGLTKMNGDPCKDLNDVSHIDPDCFEEEREVWGMMSFGGHRHE